ncbi:porin family protein [Spiribacter vilamensis]|nr:porin family protein [Spiribacter vilamensis]
MSAQFGILSSTNLRHVQTANGDKPMPSAKHLPLALALMTTTAPTMAANAGDAYVGGGFTRTSYDEQGAPEFNPSALIGRLGYYVTDNIAVEGRLGFGLSSDETSARLNGMNVTGELDIERLAGAYAVAHLPVTGAMSVYGLAGFSYAEAEITASAGGLSGSLTRDDTGFSYGVGAQAGLTEAISGYVEWASYLDQDAYEATGITIGASYGF